MSSFAETTAGKLHLKHDVVDGQPFSYYETKSNGPTIFLIHGIGDSVKTWEKQLKDPLLTSNFKVVAINLPGHGFNPLSDNFDISKLESSLIKFIKKNGLDDGIVVGWSFGGNMVTEIAESLPNVKGFFMYGTAFLSYNDYGMSPFLDNDSLDYAFQENLTEDQMDAYVASLYKPGSELPLIAQHDIRISDGKFRSAVWDYFDGQLYKDQAEILKHLTRPVAILHGKDEQLMNGDYIKSLQIPTLWEQKIHFVDHAGHAIHQENSVKFNKLLLKFADDILIN
jgi:pimeloyl-ACP methyl ester carboxylesterase